MEERNHGYLVFMLFLSLFVLVAMALEVADVLSPGACTILRYADTFVCGLFLLDFLYLLKHSKNRKQYLLTWGWLDLASSIPVLPSVPVFRFLWLSRAARVLRICRVLRCVRSGRILIRLIMEKHIQSTALAACLLVTILVTVAAVSVLHFEAGIGGTNIKTADDAVWWAIFTMMTLGYGDKFPVTFEGKALGALLAFLGMGLFGTVSGFVASRFLDAGDAESVTKLDDMKRELVAIKELLGNKASQAKGDPQERSDQYHSSAP